MVPPQPWAQAEHLDFFQKQLGFEMVDFADREAGFGGGFFWFSVVHFPEEMPIGHVGSLIQM